MTTHKACEDALAVSGWMLPMYRLVFRDGFGKGYEARDTETCLLTRIPDDDEKLMDSLRYDSECGRQTWFGVDEGSDVIETDKYCGDCGRRIKVQEEDEQ